MKRRYPSPLLRLRLLLLAATVACGGPASAQPLQRGDEWVAFGDSITQSGGYHQQAELFLFTRFPRHEITVTNAGVSGDTAARALERIDWDVVPSQPSVVSVMFGMNDVGRDLYTLSPPTATTLVDRGQRLDAWERSIRLIITTLRGANCRVFLCTPSPYDQTAQLERANDPGVDDALAECSRRVRQLATELGVGVVDFHSPLNAINQRLQARNPAATIIGPDRVHPQELGHLIMAFHLLQAMATAEPVSRVVIDAMSRQCRLSERGTVSDLDHSDDVLSFSHLAEALPFPLKDRACLDLEPLVAAMNQEVLQIVGLSGSYALQIDHERAGTLTAEQLAEGVNLALFPETPQLRQARAVADGLRKKAEVVAKLRTIAYCENSVAKDEPHPVDPARMRARLAARLATMKGAPYEQYVAGEYARYSQFKAQEAELRRQAAELAREARATALPVVRRYTLRKLPPS